MSDLPAYAVCSPESASRYAEATRKGNYNLMEFEEEWRDRYTYLLEKGYILRPRYRPDWHPSWTGTNRVPMFCEDSIPSRRWQILDATRSGDGHLVTIKIVKSKEEVEIACLLSSLLSDPLNHCVPVLHTFQDLLDNSISLMVMPYLRPFNEPPFATIGEVTDFMRQTLEGLKFMHSHGVAHRDCAAANIMMDGSPLYPQGHHPIRLDYTPDGIYDAAPLSRTDRPVRYYFIDFGLSTHFRPGEPPLVYGTKGRDKDPPELSNEVPYNAFHLDVFVLGNVYTQEFFQKYYGLESFSPLVDAMTNENPLCRPTAEGAFAMFESIYSQLNTSLRWRLRSRAESAPERVLYDAVAAAREGIHFLKRFVS